MFRLYSVKYYTLIHIVIISWIGEAICGHSEKRLLSYLFDQRRWDAHNPMERPVSVDGKPLQVFLKFFLNQIMDMDEKNQILSTILWLDIKWSDYHFQWNLSEYENIRQINLPPEKMWKPDILLYNSASEKFDQVFPTKVTVRHTGLIQWVPPGLFHSICDIEVNWFPFDSQNCILKLGTWTYQGNTVDLKLQCDNETGEDQPCHYMNEVDLSAYLAHSEWALESASVKRNVQTYGGDDQTYIDVTIYVHMQRRALYYLFNIIIPCMIMSANEKIVLGVTTLLSLTMLLQLVADKLPQTSSGNSVLVLYFTCTMILCSLSLVCAVVLLNCHHHTAGIIYVPWWVKTLINTWLASVLRIDHSSSEENLYSSREKLIPNHQNKHLHISQSDPNNMLKYDHLYNSVEEINKSSKLRDKSKILTKDKQIINSHCSIRNTSIWSNVIDMNSEFRPTLLIHNKSTPLYVIEQLKQSKLQTTIIKQNHFINEQSIRRTRDLSNQLLNQSSQKEIDDDDNNRNDINSRLEYSCKRNSITGYMNKESIQMAISNRINERDKQVKSKTMTRYHISSSDETRLDQSPEKHNEWSDKVLTSPSRTEDQSFNSPLKQTSEEEEDDDDDIVLHKLRIILEELRFITSGMHRRDQEVKTSNEWRLACRVLDRFCLLIFAALNVFTTLGILTSAPTVIKAFTSRGAPSQPM
ncbi:unnamed protein product [Heterobilharzia americana]|nr:unnamed protein product [Heterobilharzia americana]